MANRGATTVTVVDVVTGAVTKTIALDAPPYDVVAAEDRVFVSLPTANRIAIINPATLTVVGSIAVPGAPRDLDRRTQGPSPRLFISTDDGLRIYQWSDEHAVAAHCRGPRPVRGRWRPATPSLAGQVFVAACDGGATVRVVNEASGTVSAPVATGTAPCAVLNTTAAVYVANTGEDTVTVFTPALQNPLSVAVADQPIGFAEASAGVWVASASGTLTLLDRDVARRADDARDRRRTDGDRGDHPPGRLVTRCWSPMRREPCASCRRRAICCAQRRPAPGLAPSTSGTAIQPIRYR